MSCSHRSQEVVLPDGTIVRASSFHRRAAGEREPDFGVYLYDGWAPGWAHRMVEWPDFGLPRDEGTLMSALEEALNRARSGEEVEIACLGGHGRTGTALGVLAVLAGLPKEQDPVTWVKTNYCIDAVETPEQWAWLRTFAADR